MYIGDNYYQFTCICGQILLVKGGDYIHHHKDIILCSKCGENQPQKIIGKKRDEIICEICRKRIQEPIQDIFFPTIQEDGEVTSTCQDCQMLDMQGEEWKYK
jgi:hypothetical protein